MNNLSNKDLCDIFSDFTWQAGILWQENKNNDRYLISIEDLECETNEYIQKFNDRFGVDLTLNDLCLFRHNMSERDILSLIKLLKTRKIF